MNLRLRCAPGALSCMAVLFSFPAFAKPIAFANGTTVMAEMIARVPAGRGDERAHFRYPPKGAAASGI